MKHKLKITAILFLMMINIAVAAAALMPEAIEKSEKEAIEKFRQAKKFMYGKEWKKAIAAFKDIVEHFPDGKYTDDSLYWLGHSLDKMGRAMENVEESLEVRKEALGILAELKVRYPTGKWVDDAELLILEIAGELAAKGLKGFDKVVLDGIKKEQEAETKIVALIQLFDMDREKAFSIAEKIIRTGKNDKLRERAIFALGQQGDPRAIALLVEVAKKDTDKGIRENAVFWLGQMGTPESFKQLLKLYNGTADIELKKRLLFAMSQSGYKDAVKELIRIYKKETDMELKKQIIFWLGSTDSKEAKEFILEILE